jgi:hypothetical protein
LEALRPSIAARTQGSRGDEKPTLAAANGHERSQ